MDEDLNKSSEPQAVNPAGAPGLKKIKRPIKRPVAAPMGGVPLPPGAAGNGAFRLKKIKRPIKRPVINPMSGRPLGGESATGQVPASSMAVGGEDPFTAGILSESKTETTDAEINNILDAPAEPQSFQLPQKPSGPTFRPEQPRFVSDSDLQDTPAASSFIQGDLFTRQAVGIVGIVMVLIGFFIGKFLFTEETVVREGLQGVVVNPEVPKGRARCGIAEKTQGCVLYIMNPQRQDLRARDFYDLASQLTGRQRFVIETGNMRYSNTKISPGEIVQLNIPPLQ